MTEIDIDAEMDAWWDANACAARAAFLEEHIHHRCPQDMPPCPVCQEIIAEEDWREYGGQ